VSLTLLWPSIIDEAHSCDWIPPTCVSSGHQMAEVRSLFLVDRGDPAHIPWN